MRRTYKSELSISNCISEDGNPLENLANAIIVQAVRDYVSGYRREEVLQFFNSDWYKILTDLPSECIIKIAREQAGEI